MIIQKDLSHQVACLNDFRARDAIVDLYSVPAGFKDSRVSHEREVLRNVRFGDLHSSNDVSRGHFVMSKDAEDLKPLGVGESLADVGVEKEYLVAHGGR